MKTLSTSLIIFFAILFHNQLHSQQEFCYDVEFISCGETVTGSTSNSSNDFDFDDFDDCRSISSTFNGGDNVYSFERTYDNEVNYITLDQRGNNGGGSKLDIFLFNDCVITPTNNPCVSTTYNNVAYLVSTISVIKLDQGAPGTYYIVVDGANASSVGSYSLTVSCEGFNCNDAETIECNETVRGNISSNDINNNSGYTADCITIRNFNGNVDNANGMFQSGEDYYRFIVPEDGDYSIDLTALDSNQDLELFVFNADQCCDPEPGGGGVHIFVVPDGSCDAICEEGSTNSSGDSDAVSIPNANEGDEYIIVVDGFSLSMGAYDLTVTCPDALCEDLFSLPCGIQLEDTNDPNAFTNLSAGTVPTELIDQHNFVLD